MTEQPSWAGDVPSYTAVRGPLPAPQWDEVSQNTLDDLRLRLRESVTESILMAVRGFFIPGPLGAAFEQLVDWSSEVLNAQNLLDAMNGNYTGDNGVLLAIEAIFTPIRGIVNAIVEPLREWLTWMWNLFSNITPNPEPTGLGAAVLVPLFKWLDSLWEGFGDVIENVFAFVLNLFKPLAPASGGTANPDEFWDGVASTKTGANLLPDPRIDTARLWKQAGLAVSTAFSNTTYTSTTTQSLEFTGNGAARSFYWPTGFLGLPYDIGTWPDRIYYVECYVYLPAANPNTTATVKMFGKASIIPFGNGDDVAAMTFTSTAGPGPSGTWQNATLTNPAKGGTSWTKMFGYFKIPTLRNGFTAGITFTASTSHKIYVDDLAIIDVTEAVTTNNKLYGRPTPADTIDAGTKLTGQIPDAQVPQITTTWNELYDAFDNSTTPPGTQRTVAQVRTASATVRGSAVAGENKSTTLNTLLYNSQAPTGTILTAAVPSLDAGTKLTGTVPDAQLGPIRDLVNGQIESGANLIPNPGFERLNFLGNSAFVTEQKRRGSRSLKLTANGVNYASYGMFNDNVTSFQVPVTPGDVYYYELWYRGHASNLRHRNLTVSATGGTFTITVGANTTGAIAFNATAATVQAALVGLASVGAGNATVTGSNINVSPGLAMKFGASVTGAISVTTTSLTGGGASLFNTNIFMQATSYNQDGTATGYPSVAATTADDDNGVWKKMSGYLTIPAGTVALPTVSADFRLYMNYFMPSGLIYYFDDAFLARVTDANQINKALYGPTANAPGNAILTAQVPSGIDTTKLTGTLADAQIPVISTLKIPELPQDKITDLDVDLGYATETADNASGTGVTNSSQIVALQAAQQSSANSGRSGGDGFDYTTNTGLTPPGGTSSWDITTVGTGTGTVRANGNSLAWVPGTTATATVRARFTKTTTVTSYQEVSVVIDGPIFNALSSGASPTPMVALVCRLNSTWTSYVYARLVPTGSGNVQLTLWKVSGGSEAQITVAGAGIYSWKLKIGDTIQVLAGDTTALTFRLYLNGNEVASINDSSAIGGFVSVENAATNNFTGLMLRNGAVGAVSYSPCSLASFAMTDSAPPDVAGSGIRIRRTAISTATISAGENIFPQGWFGDIVTGQRTLDLGYDVSGTNTGRVTVSIEGWYQCQLSVATNGNSVSGGVVYSILWKGSGTAASSGGVSAGSVAMYGGQSRFNSPGGTGPVINGSFLIYLKAGEWVEPGYYSNQQINSAMGSTDSTFVAKTTWWSVALVNRSYN